MSTTSSIAFALLTTLGVGSDPDDPPTRHQFQLTVKANAMARGIDLRIGELCDITPASADSLAIGRLRFGPAPVPGFPRTVTRTQLLQTLVSAGHSAGSFKFRGATEAIVQAVFIDVSARRLVDEATSMLQTILAHEGGDVEYEVVGRVRNVQASAGHRSQELQARIRDGKTNPASAVIDVQILVDGQVAKTVPVQFKLIRFQMILQTVGTIRAGAALGAHNLQLTRQKAANTPGLYLTSLDQLDGMIARRNLQPNRLLMLNDTGPPAVIRRGEVVDVVITRRRVKVMVRGIANKDAALGETITVTNRQSKSQITGIVAAPGTVVVPTGN